jgi:hypothetical protein
MEGRNKERKTRKKEERAVDTHQAHGNSKSSHLSNKSTP